MKNIVVLLLAALNGVWTILSPCKDSGVWIADGLVSCQYLEKSSAYGYHKNPAGFCQQYHTECCLTCSKLQKNGYTSVTNRYPSAAATTLASILSPQFPVAIYKSRAKSPCKDSGVWIADGLVSCIYLERPSVYGIHNNPREFCAQYYLECCLTCAKFNEKYYTETLPLISATSVMTSSKEIIHSRSNNISTLLDTIAPQRSLPNVQREIMSLHKQIIRFRKFLQSFKKKLTHSFHEHCKNKTN